MSDAILQFAHDAMASPWIYAVIFAVSALDAFFPIVPSETLVITAGVFSASSGAPSIGLIILFAAVGAFIGDHISYAIGRFVGRPILDRAKPGSKRRQAFDWAAAALLERGGLVLVVARYIPGGRTAITLTMGALHYPLKNFAFFDTIAAVSWGFYSGLIGFIGGAAFEENPLMGLLLGLGIAAGVTVLVEVVRHFRKRNRAKGEVVEAEEPAESRS